MTAPTRPALRWHGGKWKLAPWIISHFPLHRVYVEPFGGGASVLLRKPRAYAEVYNDLDGDVVNLFRCLQDPARAQRLIEMLRLTPFARAEFEIGWDDTDDAVEMARRLIIRSFMGFGSNAHNNLERGHKTTGFRANSSRSRHHAGDGLDELSGPVAADRRAAAGRGGRAARCGPGDVRARRADDAALCRSALPA